MIGQIISHYRVLEKIGEGGMGVVYLARDTRLDREVALKVLPAGTLADEAARKRFRREALALAKLNHPHIAMIFDFDTQEGVDFLVMEYLPGVTLKDRLDAGGLAEKETLRWGAQLAEGLAAAHEQGVVHRDLKPANLQIAPDGRLKILDFGLAKLLRPVSQMTTADTLGETQAGAGTLPYMAPEQLRGEPADARTDIHAAGAVLHEMATGQRAFPQAQGSLLIAAILNQPPRAPRSVNPRISAGLENIILKALDKEPENRYQSAKELGVDLRRLIAPTSTPAVEPATHARRVRRAALLTGLAVVLLLAIPVGLNLGGWRNRLLGRPASPQIESLAVLPLANLSRDPEQDYFAEGMTEALIIDLSKISALRVISRTSAMRYKGTQKPLHEIAEALHVDALIEGTVARSADRVRITANLIQASPERHLWAESYERNLSDVLALQNDVARDVANKVKIKLTGLDQSRLATGRTVDPEAYQLYLKGRYFSNKRTEQDLKKALQYFQHSIDKDPSYAQAYAGLADTYLILGYVDFLPPKEADSKAKAATLKALEIDDSVAEAHASLGAALAVSDRDWLGAERELRRAIELDPNDARTRHWYAFVLSTLGRTQECLVEAKRSLELDPLSLVPNMLLASCFYYARQYDRAIEQLQKTLELDPNSSGTQWTLGKAYQAKGAYQEAVAHYKSAVSLSEESSITFLAALGQAYGLSSNRSEAQQVLQRLNEFSASRYVSPFDIALVHAGLGQNDQAFAWLERAREDRSNRLLLIKVEPVLDALRGDSRFADLLRRVGLPP